MKKYLFILVFFIPFTFSASELMLPELLFENTEGVLCLGKRSNIIPSSLVTTDSLLLVYRDTILPDGTPSRLYTLPYSASSVVKYSKSFFVYWQFPDGVRVMLNKDSTSFLYPSGLSPGLYNLASKHIRVVEGYVKPSEARLIVFEHLNAPKQASPQSKPYPNKDCQYRGTSMYANVKVLDESQAFVSRNTPKYYVRVIDADSDEKADFDVHPVVNNRWGTECAQWRWVDKDEDFCVIFGYGGNFTIRIIEK